MSVDLHKYAIAYLNQWFPGEKPSRDQFDGDVSALAKMMAKVIKKSQKNDTGKKDSSDSSG